MVDEANSSESIDVNIITSYKCHMNDIPYIFINRNSINNFFMELASEDCREFSNFCRMSPSDFEILFEKIKPMIEKEQTRLRMEIPGKIRLALTLRYLATGDSYRSLHYLFKVSTSAFH